MAILKGCGAALIAFVFVVACTETPTARDGGPKADGPTATQDGTPPPRDGIPPPRDTGPLPDGALQPVPWGYFPAQAVWYRDYSQASLHANSDAIIAWLDNAGGWGGGSMRIDFSIEVLRDDGSAPMRTFEPTDEHWTPHCDIAPVPVPEGGALEGEDGYECTTDGDCHLIVVHEPTLKLYEMWRANIVGGTFRGGCLAVWDMTRVYGDEGRGAQCTSADAAGYPIAPLLFSADEVAAGEIKHAIRFILPNARIKNGVYTAPATHSTSATSGGANAPPYGVHLRLKAGVDISGLKTGAQVVARALKKYGMFLSDGGTIALTAQSDRFTSAKWDGLLAAGDLEALQVTDFEVVDHGPEIPYTDDCVRVD